MNLDAPRFSIVIVHRNGAEMLCNMLAQLVPLTAAEEAEIVLVDNGSADASVSQVTERFPAIQVIQNGCNNGFARACNQGLRASSGEYVLFLNNDAVLPDGALARFAEDFLRFPHAALIGGQLVGPDGAPQRSIGRAPTFWSEVGFKRRPLPGVPANGQPVEAETLVGACMALRRSAADSAGPLDEDFFFYFEETEWCVRLRRKGWQVLFDPAIRITHLKGASTRPFRREAQIEMFRSRLLYYRKTLPALQASVLTAWRIGRLVLNILSHALMVLVSLGGLAKARAKLSVYLTQLAWLLRGRPEAWGLPDKCPRRR